MSNDTFWVAIGTLGLIAVFAIDRLRSARRRAFLSPAQSAAPAVERPTSSAGVSQDLRHLILESSMDPGSPGKPIAIIMDIAYPQAVASVMASAFGDASIYFSTGGGILGGVGHEPAREAATAFVAAATTYLPQFQRVVVYPYPVPGNVRFYVRTPESVYMGEASERALAEGNNPLSSLFNAGQEVITQLRLATGDFKRPS